MNHFFRLDLLSFEQLWLISHPLFYIALFLFLELAGCGEVGLSPSGVPNVSFDFERCLMVSFEFP